MHLPDTLEDHLQAYPITESMNMVKQLWMLPRPVLQGLLREIEDNDIQNNSLLSNGWSAGTFAMTYLRLLFFKKRVLEGKLI